MSFKQKKKTFNNCGQKSKGANTVRPVPVNNLSIRF